LLFYVRLGDCVRLGRERELRETIRSDAPQELKVSLSFSQVVVGVSCRDIAGCLQQQRGSLVQLGGATPSSAGFNRA